MTVSMKKSLNITKYLMSIMTLQIIITVGTLLVNAAIGLILKLLGNDGGGSLDLVAFIWCVVYGLITFAYSFKFSLVNGTSRKSCYLGCLIALAITAFTVSVSTSIIAAISTRNIQILNTYTLIYGKNVLGLFMWELCAMLFLVSVGWLIAALNYRLVLKVKLIIMGGLVVLSPLLFLIQSLSKGGLLRGVARFFSAVMGLSSASPNPFIACLFLLGLSAALCGLVFLIIRRAGIRE